MNNQGWVVVANQFLDNGTELMLTDSFTRNREQKSYFKKTLKVACVVVYYGIKLYFNE